MRRPWPVLVLLAACAPDGSSDDEPSVSTVQVCPALPAGVAAAEVIDPFGAAPIDAGCADVTVTADGPILTVATTASGTPLAMGWVDADHTELSSRTTAMVLLTFATGGVLLPDAPRATFRTLLAADATVDDVAAALDAALTDDVEAFGGTTSGAAAVATAVQTAATALATFDKRTLTAGPAYATLATPSGAQSGVSVDTTAGVNEVALVNSFRRRAFAYIDRVSVFDANGAQTPSPAAIARFTVEPVQGTEGTLGTISQILAGTQEPGGFENSQNIAYVPRSSAPVTLVNVEGAKKTRYRIAVVGPGTSAGAYDELSTEERDKQLDVSLEFVTVEMVLPIVLDLLLPQEGLDRWTQSPGFANAVADIVRILKDTTPAIVAQVQAEDYGGALRGIAQELTGTGTFRTLVLEAIVESLYDFRTAEGIEGYGKASAVAGGFLRVTTAVDGLLTAFDSSAIGASLANAHQADTWTVDVIASPVRLLPPEATIAVGRRVTLRAVLQDAGDDAYEYRFHLEGTTGTLATDTMTGADVVSSRSWVTYDAGEVTEAGTAVVSVEVFSIDGQDRTPLGDATAVVTVEETCHDEGLPPVTWHHLSVPFTDGTGTAWVSTGYWWLAVPGYEDYQYVFHEDTIRGPTYESATTVPLYAWPERTGANSLRNTFELSDIDAEYYPPFPAAVRALVPESPDVRVTFTGQEPPDDPNGYLARFEAMNPDIVPICGPPYPDGY
ncbi:MAG: hypothetical protein H6733_11585 [Alphaproteobacteria bacterium]|nr:hypothetical protein [Alphaproteobacteria bacterium]